MTNNLPSKTILGCPPSLFAQGIDSIRTMAVLIFLLFAVFPSFLPAFALNATGTVDVFFSPKGGVTAAIVDEIEGAKKRVLVQAYVFTSKPIERALAKAAKRGLEVTVILDGEMATGKQHPRWFFGHKGKGRHFNPSDLFKNSNVRVYLDRRHEIAHNKVMILDDRTLITGSFNFTRQAEEENAENILIIKENPALAERYLKNFYEHLRHSDKR